jgi:hypothetical protein
MYPSLARSYKGIFPFKLGTTSFIYPDHYIPNVKMLGPYLDEIELLLFESLPADALPSKAVIAELSDLAREYDLTYNIQKAAKGRRYYVKRYRSRCPALPHRLFAAYSVSPKII